MFKFLLIVFLLLSGGVAAICFLRVLYTSGDEQALFRQTRLHVLLCGMVVTIGLLLVSAGWCLSFLRLSRRHIFLVLLSASLGLMISSLSIAYDSVGGAWCYQFFNGYPFGILVRSFCLDQGLSWSHGVEYLQHHPEQVRWNWDYAWSSFMVNALFYVHVSIILLLAFRGMWYYFVRRNNRDKS
jgi:hypothetical protein